MGFILYILQSRKSGKLYIGQTQDLEERINRPTKDFQNQQNQAYHGKLYICKNSY